jgi:UPF0716 protein FxsA
MHTDSPDILPIYATRRRRSLSGALICLIFLLAAAQGVLLFLVGHYALWNIWLAINAVTGVLGLIVMGVAIVRYGRYVAARLDRDECLDDRLSNGLLLVPSGVLLVLPGSVTHFLGLLLLVPRTRRLLIAGLKRYFGPAASGAAPTVQFPRAFREEQAEIADGRQSVGISSPSKNRAA